LDFWSKLGFILAVGGIGISVAAFFATYIWREIPRWVASIGFSLGVLLCAGAAACFVLIPEPGRPEVTLRFVEGKAPDLQLTNISEVTATNIKWMMIAFDLDALAYRKQPLPIPATTFDFLTPGNSSLPINLFDPPASSSSIVKSGDRIFGSVSVDCPECKRGHTYVFYITLGQGGWYSERTEITNGNNISPANMNLIQEAADAVLKQTPEAMRTPIKDLPPAPVRD